MKKCSCCKTAKSLDDFPSDKSSKDGSYAYCKTCSTERSKTYYKLNRSSVLKKRKVYSQTNSDKIKNYKKEYSKKNREEIRAYFRKYQPFREKHDKQYLLARRIRSRIRAVLKFKKKPGSAIKDMGCSLIELKVHLESQFHGGMSWSNYGQSGWHIDHITPLSTFDLTDRGQFLKAVHYTNLQPLWAVDNLKKGNKKDFFKSLGSGKV